MKLDIYFRYQMVTFLCLYISYIFIIYMRKSFTYIAPVISKEKNLGKSDLGLISSCQLFAYSMSKFMFGLAVDHYSARRLLVASLVLTALSTILFSQGGSLWVFATLWFLNGWCQGVAWPACAKILVAWSPAAGLGTWWSLLSTSMNVAGTVGPLVAMTVVHYTDWQTSMLLPGLISLFLASTVFLVLKDQPSDVGLANIHRTPPKTAGAPVASSTILDLLFDKTIMTLSLCYMLSFCVTSGLGDWGQMYLIQERSRTNIEGSMYMSSLQFGGVMGSIVAGYTSDKLVARGHPPVQSRIYILSVMTAISSVCLYVFITMVTPVSSYMTINALGFGLGFGFYGDVSLFGVAAIDAAPRHLTGAAHSIAALFCNVGGILAGLPLSLLAKHYGWTDALWVLLLANCITFAILLSMTREKRVIMKKSE